jgi:drug/metabolite transporter (DMT)-like permease
MLAITVAYFTAVQFLPLADALGLLLLYPLISAAMAAVWLGERVGLATMLIMSTAFGGALLVVKPGFATVNIGVFCALGAAVAVALNIVINRHLAGRTPTIVGLFYSSVIGLVISTVLIPFDWTLPDPGQWLLLAVLGLVMAAATYFVYLAFSFAPTATVAPFGYSEVITATVLGYVLFADFPDGASLAGIAVITACGMWIALRGPR